MNYFSLNNRYSNLYNSLLMITVISTIYMIFIVTIYKERPSNIHIQKCVCRIEGMDTYT